MKTTPGRRRSRPGGLSPSVRTFTLHGLMRQKELRLARGPHGWIGEEMAWPVPAREFREWLARAEESGRIVRLSTRATRHVVFAAASGLLFGQAVSDLSALSAAACEQSVLGRKKA